MFKTFGCIALKTLKYLASQSFDFERTWWRLFQMRTRFDTFSIVGSLCHDFAKFVVCMQEGLCDSFMILQIFNYINTMVPLVGKELLLTLPEQQSSPLGFSGVRVIRYLVLCVCFVDRYLSFVLVLLAIVLSVLLRYTDYDYPFCIFKLFLISMLEWSLWYFHYFTNI